jgi:hypothetical protein
VRVSGTHQIPLFHPRAGPRLAPSYAGLPCSPDEVHCSARRNDITFYRSPHSEALLLADTGAMCGCPSAAQLYNGRLLVSPTGVVLAR